MGVNCVAVKNPSAFQVNIPETTHVEVSLLVGLHVSAPEVSCRRWTTRYLRWHGSDRCGIPPQCQLLPRVASQFHVTQPSEH